ncbi:MAG: acyltransferase family protein [Ilumatobacteraceae bacterium]
MTTPPATSTAVAVSSSPQRRHDLDALRGLAMLLGVGLHASLAFFPAGWPVTDGTANVDGWFDEFFHAVHGFRMPLFFLMSGFFTTMLFRRRGLGSLLRQRVTRVALPLVIGVFTIVPLVDWASGRAAPVEQQLEAAIIAGNTEATQAVIDDGFDVNTLRYEESTYLHLAAFAGHPDIVEVLLEAGADPRAREVSTGSSTTATAVWSGNEAVADLLVAAGAADERSPGKEWRDLDWFGDGIDFRNEVLAAGKDATTAGPKSWIDRFHHLWFLWFLCIFVVGYAIAVGIATVARRAADRDHVISDRAVTMLMWLLVPLTLVPQFMMGESGEEKVFGPDTSTELVPAGHVLGYYAVFFTFGALLYGTRNHNGDELVDTVGRHWKIMLPLTLVVVLPFGIGATFGYGIAPEVFSGWIPAMSLQVLYTWGMIFGLMGLFGTVLAVERRGVRYLSDSAYWLYLAHLPLIITGQAWIRGWEVPASAKFIGLCAISTLILLASYQLFVRYTPIGWLLNGRRTPTRFLGPRWCGKQRSPEQALTTGPGAK